MLNYPSHTSQRWHLPAMLLISLAIVSLGPVATANADTLDGKIVFWRTSKISTPISGRIEALPKRVGDFAKKGEVLAQIDTRQLKANLVMAESTLKRARAELVSAEAVLTLEMTEFKRAEGLKGSPAFSLARLEDTNNRVAVAKSNVETARARIAESEALVAKQKLNVDLATIEAPFNGIVVRHVLTVGSLVSIETPDVLVLVDNTSPEIQANVPVEQISQLRVGTEVNFSINNGKRERARVRTVMPAEKPGAETRIVRLEIINADGQYFDTDTVTIDLPSS